MWNAGILAFKKGLGVYARPEPVGQDAGGSEPSETEVVSEKWGQVGTTPGDLPGGLVWIAPSASELHARDLTVAFLRHRLSQLHALDPSRQITVNIQPSDPALPSLSLSSCPSHPEKADASVLTLAPISLQAFSLLLLSPTPAHALATLSRPHPHTLLRISSPELCTLLFSPSSTSDRLASSSYAQSAARLLRRCNPLSPPSVRALAAQARHWTEELPDGVAGGGWKMVRGMAGTVLAEWAEEGAMALLGVKFVERGEGWRYNWRTSGVGPEGRD